MKEELKHYTYKVTFPGMPWFYFGVHTDKGEPYFGSPVTHRWKWKMYDHETQILEWFETRKEAEKVEDRIIRHFLNDPNCLNEHWGGGFSREVSRRVGANTPIEQLSKMGRKTQSRKDESGRSLHALETLVPLHRNKDNQGRSKNAVKAATALHSVKDEEGRSIAALRSLHSQKNSEGKSIVGVKTATTNNLKRWMDPDHPELGVRSAPTLVRMQKIRGYPSNPENRQIVSQPQE
jgi:hypothetical protein